MYKSISALWYICFFLLPSNSAAQNSTHLNYAVTEIPSALLLRANATLREERIDVRMKSPTQVETKIFKAITIHNELGQSFADLLLYYYPSRKIKKVEGVVLNSFGIEISKFKLKDFADMSASGESNLYDDTRVKVFSPQSVHYPFTVVYSIEISDQQNLSIPRWMPNYATDLSVEKSQYSFSYPSDEKIRIHEQNYSNVVEQSNDGKQTTVTWQIKNFAAVQSEPFSPPRHLTATSVRIVPVNFQYFKNKGSFTNWEEFGKWQYETLLVNKRKLPDYRVEEIKNRLRFVESPKEKARILYKYLQDRTRYVSIQIGIGGLEPFSAETVDHLGYGDCKALVNYMQALLDVAGIESYYCIVEAGTFKTDITQDFANVSDGNHIILCIPFENDTTWLECTSQKLPFGYLGDFTDDRLVVASSSAGGQLLRTPSFKDFESLQHREVYLSVERDGSLNGVVNTKFTGSQLENHYYNSFVSSKEQQQNLFKWYPIDNIDFTKFNYTTSVDSTEMVEENLEVYIKNYGVISGNQMILIPNIFNRSPSIPAIRQRQNEVFINRGYSDFDVIHFTFPEEWKLEIQPFKKELSIDIATYSVELAVHNQILTWTRKLELRSGYYPKESYANWHAFMQEIQMLDGLKYTINSK